MSSITTGNEEAAASKHATQWVGLVEPGVSVPFDSIRAPGCYVCTWSGHLMRVPEEALTPNGVINIVGPEPLLVTKISDDPAMPLSEARRAALGFGLPVSF